MAPFRIQGTMTPKTLALVLLATLGGAALATAAAPALAPSVPTALPSGAGPVATTEAPPFGVADAEGVLRVEIHSAAGGNALLSIAREGSSVPLAVMSVQMGTGSTNAYTFELPVRSYQVTLQNVVTSGRGKADLASCTEERGTFSFEMDGAPAWRMTVGGFACAAREA